MPSTTVCEQPGLLSQRHDPAGPRLHGGLKRCPRHSVIAGKGEKLLDPAIRVVPNLDGVGQIERLPSGHAPLENITGTSSSDLLACEQPRSACCRFVLTFIYPLTMLPKRNLAPVAVVTLGGFGLYTLTGDAVAQARDPLTPKDDHDSFVLMATTTTSDTVMVIQNTVTGEPIEAPLPTMVALSLGKRDKV